MQYTVKKNAIFNIWLIVGEGGPDKLWLLNLFDQLQHMNLTHYNRI